eukprot:CAMPEP_0119039896 /NCGR_PEP_ID=MMETSP1177-20130426/9647_1 /TAXON_ID=2985 /ORGANISM="Ochromonas sp, Strain CCMP1899" /LENGTH=245 /DNA_ID=CAMNT_0007004381 /DNA_START=129 /DNA_END=866 /DNA_ORIENTATION=-
MSLVTISIRSFNLPSKISSLNNVARRSFQIESTKFSTQDLQGKLFSPLQSDEGLDLMKIGIASTSVKNTQSILLKKKLPIDAKKVKQQIAAIKEILGVPHFQVDVWFCSDKKIKSMNEEWRDVSKSTDVLSFPANDFESPGVFSEDSSLEFEKHLGDLVVSPAYVMRQCKRDKKDFESDEFEDDESAGVSKAMSTVYTLEERLPLLLIHGMIHLLGYDHETDEDFLEMTTKEDEVIAKFKLKKFL